MKYLEEMSMIVYLQKKLKGAQRNQLNKNVIEDIKTVLSSTVIALDKEITPMLSATIEDLFQALNTLESMDITAIPDDVKSSIVEGIYIIKMEVSKLAFNHYTVETFEVTPEIEEVMREVVLTYYMGGIK